MLFRSDMDLEGEKPITSHSINVQTNERYAIIKSYSQVGEHIENDDELEPNILANVSHTDSLVSLRSLREVSRLMKS